MTIVFIKGDDQVLVSQEVLSQVNSLVGDGDKSLMVEELTEATYLDENGLLDIATVVNAVQTPPFLTERRVVVARNLSSFSKKELILPLVRVLEKTIENVDCVFVWEKATNATRLAAVPKVLKDVLKSIGAEEINASPKGKAVKAVLQDKLSMAPVQLDQSARNAISEITGDNVGSLDSLFETLVSTYGEDTRLSAAEVVPFLGQGSDVPPWELTDAIDQGNIKLSLEKLSRMVEGGGRHPLQILAVLHSHYQKALTLDGAGVSNEKEAAAILEMKGSTFPAKKAMMLSKKLGQKKVRRAISLLCDADIDIRGATALQPVAVTEVLVARLAQMSR